RSVAGLGGEADALIDEPLADAQPARRWFHEQEPQLRDSRGLANQKDGPDDLAIFFGDPAALALRIIVLEEFGNDLGDQRLEPLVPSELVRVQGGMAVDHPPHVSGP